MLWPILFPLPLGNLMALNFRGMRLPKGFRFRGRWPAGEKQGSFCARMRANCLLAIATKTGQVMRIVVQCPGIDVCHGGIFFLTSFLRTQPGAATRHGCPRLAVPHRPLLSPLLARSSSSLRLTPSRHSPNDICVIC